MRVRIVSLSLVSIVALIVGIASRSDAGCGCQKPPPVASVIRPNFATPGTEVTFTHPGLVVGRSYAVTFTRGSQSATIDAVAESRRDRADAQIKPQLVVAAPSLGAGPASVSVRELAATTALFSVPDADFTLLTEALAIPAARGAWSFAGTQAAVSRGGVVYLALDLTGLEEPLIFEAQAVGYPLRFAAEDVLFYNSQGYLMQLLVSGGKASPVPGMFVKSAISTAQESDVLHYSRHEFSTYFLQHAERQAHTVTADGWHADGTPHIDHNQLIIAIHGRTDLGAPVAGVTPPFDLKVKAYSIFHAGLVGTEKVEVKDTAQTDSYDGTTMEQGQRGDIASHRDVLVKDTSVVLGNVTGAKITRELAYRDQRCEVRPIDGASPDADDGKCTRWPHTARKNRTQGYGSGDRGPGVVLGRRDQARRRRDARDRQHRRPGHALRRRRGPD